MYAYIIYIMTLFDSDVLLYGLMVKNKDVQNREFEIVRPVPEKTKSETCVKFFILLCFL